MLINETSKITNVTKKAIEYYIEQGLLSPAILDNGYRDFSENDVECLNKISILRKVGLSTEEIKTVFADKTGSTLQKLSVQKELTIQREQVRKNILDQLACGKSYSDVVAELKAIEQGRTITDRLLDAFPGYYGRFICLHFARFLNEPIKTKEQLVAYQEILEFLDNIPSLHFAKELQDYLIEYTQHSSSQNIIDMIENTKQSIEDPDKFLSENKEILEQYLAFKQSDEYKNSPVFTMQNLLKEFNRATGYYDVFIPAMKRLSASYAEYYRQMELANDKLLEQYPEIAKLNCSSE